MNPVSILSEFAKGHDTYLVNMTNDQKHVTLDNVVYTLYDHCMNIFEGNLVLDYFQRRSSLFTAIKEANTVPEQICIRCAKIFVDRIGKSLPYLNDLAPESETFDPYFKGECVKWVDEMIEDKTIQRVSNIVLGFQALALMHAAISTILAVHKFKQKEYKNAAFWVSSVAVSTVLATFLPYSATKIS
jgi:hypothetical protein